MAEAKKKKVHVRTWYDLGDYEDNESSFPPSIVDTYGYESLSDMVSRIRRGEVLLPMPSDEGDYGDDEVDEAFDRTEPIEDDLTDLDDARELIESQARARAESEALQKQKMAEMMKYREEQIAKDRPKVESVPEEPQEPAPEQKKKGWFS